MVHLTAPTPAWPAGVALLVHLHSLFKDFGFLRTNFIDLLYGSDALRTLIGSGASPEAIVMSWQDDLTWFQPMRAKYLIYS